jgi:hypothetical protein
MELHALYLTTGSGWVADVKLRDDESYRVDDQIMLGNIRWVIRGIEWQGDNCTRVGLRLRPERIENERFLDRGSVEEEEKKAMPTRDIGWAVQTLKLGGKVTRAGWNGKNMWLALRAASPDAETKRSGQPMTLPFVYMKTVQGDYVPWLCSQTDLLAEDWEEVQ